MRKQKEWSAMSAHEQFCNCECHDPVTRFWKYVDKSDECWIWQAQINSTGYGKFWMDGKMRFAHRLAYQFTTGEPVPDDLTVDHLCRTRPCVNPAHMELVTRSENTRRVHARNQKDVSV